LPGKLVGNENSAPDRANLAFSIGAEDSVLIRCSKTGNRPLS
jgi:hypothetical protein